MDINMNEQPGFAAGGPGDAFGPCSQASLPKVLQTACTGYPHRMLDRPRSAGAPQPRSATVGMQSTETRRCLPHRHGRTCGRASATASSTAPVPLVGAAGLLSLCA